MQGAADFRSLLQGPRPVLAPLVLNPLMAKLAERAGFPALYLGGGGMGFLTCATEANLTVTEMCAAGLAIRASCRLPLILDAGGGWGDPVHIGHTIAWAEAAGFSAIEIEDQVLPKRVHHHVGIERLVPLELMTAKIAQAVASRRDPALQVIGRTNAARTNGLDEALRRGEALKRAGADILFVPARTVDEEAVLAARLPGPLMYMSPARGLSASGITLAELSAMGFRLVVDSTLPLLAMHRAIRAAYAAMIAGEQDPTVGPGGDSELGQVLELIGIGSLLEVERRTTERG